MHPHALERLEHDQVDSEALDAQLAAQRLEAIGAVGIEGGECHIRVGHGLDGTPPPGERKRQSRAAGVRSNVRLPPP